MDTLAVALLDVLDTFDEVRVCEAYEIDGRRTRDFPSHAEDLAIARPVYRTLPGWKSDTTACRSATDLPPNAKRYAETLAELLGVPLGYVGVGPDREQTVVMGG